MAAKTLIATMTSAQDAQLSTVAVELFGMGITVGWEGDVLGLHGGIDRDPRQILRPQRPALVRHPQALGQEDFQLAAQALAPMAQVRALVRKLVPEELLSGEVLEVWIIDPAFAHPFVGQSVNMLEQKKPDHKLCRNSCKLPGPQTRKSCNLKSTKPPKNDSRSMG
jgi:hypothetical protein